MTAVVNEMERLLRMPSYFSVRGYRMQHSHWSVRSYIVQSALSYFPFCRTRHRQKIFKQRHIIISKIRNFFWSHRFLFIYFFNSSVFKSYSSSEYLRFEKLEYFPRFIIGISPRINWVLVDSTHHLTYAAT